MLPDICYAERKIRFVTMRAARFMPAAATLRHARADMPPCAMRDSADDARCC